MLPLFASRVIAALLLLAALFIGFAQIALLPPWEGFDETAHYSYIQQLAETGRWPRLGDPISAEINEYLEVAPAAASLRPPWSYASIAVAPHETIEVARALIHTPPEGPRNWRPGNGANWQAQHPPLYYLAMAPIYLVSKNWSIARQLLFMRGISYLFAFAGLCLAAIIAAREVRRVPGTQATMLLGVAFWPFFFPMWFPEMARLGNDSLLVLPVACALPLATRLMSAESTVYQHAALGVVLGLGLLTKATFLPFAAVTIALLTFRILSLRGDAELAWRQARQLMLLSAVMMLVCGWWYLQKYVETGSAIGSNDVVHMQESGGLGRGLAQHASLYMLAKIPWVIGISFLWGGTWSFVLPPLAAILPLVLGAAILAAGCFLFVRTHALWTDVQLPLLTLAAMLAALFYHSLVLISTGGTPASGWYLHALAPVFAVLAGFGLAGAASSLLIRPALIFLIAYPLVFLPIAMSVQAMVFAGCVAPNAGEAYFPILALGACAARWDTLTGNLSVLGSPRLSTALFTLGWGIALIGIVAALRSIQASAPADITTTR